MAMLVTVAFSLTATSPNLRHAPGVSTYESQLRLHIRPATGDGIELGKLTPATVREWRAQPPRRRSRHRTETSEFVLRRPRPGHWFPTFYARAVVGLDYTDDGVLAKARSLRRSLDVVQAAIEQLRGSQREVITMRDVLGSSAAEVCDVLGVSEGNQRPARPCGGRQVAAVRRGRRITPVPRLIE
jgi:hypothetical protein